MSQKRERESREDMGERETEGERERRDAVFRRHIRRRRWWFLLPDDVWRRRRWFLLPDDVWRRWFDPTSLWLKMMNDYGTGE
ncbi:hypothetical protein Hanom_Chr00s000001g01592651 [Helianthus anomalus]